MIKPIESFESKEGYVIENESRYKSALIYYEKEDGILTPEVLGIFPKEILIDVENEEELRKFLREYGLKGEETVYIRKDVEEIPLSMFEYD